MLGQDIVILLKLAIEPHKNLPAKQLADELFLPASDVSRALQRCQQSGLLYRSDMEKRVNRQGLVEFVAHGLRYVFPPERGGLERGLPTAASIGPLKSLFVENVEPPFVWPYAEGTMRGQSLAPLYKGAPRAALRDARLYELMALCDSVRVGRNRERNLALEKISKELVDHDRSQSTAS